MVQVDALPTGNLISSQSRRSGAGGIPWACTASREHDLARNKLWFNQKLKPHAFDRKLALHELELDGFRLQGDVLRDIGGHPVEFSVITNAGNKDREQMAAMIQQDLRAIGIRLNIVTLDFPSLIERITRTFNYEACLLGFMNDLDPTRR